MWFTMGVCALRAEQARGCVVNAFVDSVESSAVLLVAAAIKDKHPDRSKQRPRPVFGDLAGILYQGAVQSALVHALDSAPGALCVLLDTDSPSGNPLDADTWIACPLSDQARVDASLQALLQLKPIGLTAAAASEYHGHSAKRFMLNFIDACPDFDSIDANEYGRFSGSTAQADDVTPTEALLQQHALRAAVLPDIYAGRNKISAVLDLVGRVGALLRRWARLHAMGAVSLPPEDGWEFFRRVPPVPAATAIPSVEASSGDSTAIVVGAGPAPDPG